MKVTTMPIIERDQALGLFDKLDPAQQAAALRFMEFLLLDPVQRAAALAQPDDEPVTHADRQRVLQGREWLAQRDGKGIPMEEVLAEFNLSLADFPIRK